MYFFKQKSFFGRFIFVYVSNIRILSEHFKFNNLYRFAAKPEFSFSNRRFEIYKHHVFFIYTLTKENDKMNGTLRVSVDWIQRIVLAGIQFWFSFLHLQITRFSPISKAAFSKHQTWYWSLIDLSEVIFYHEIIICIIQF